MLLLFIFRIKEDSNLWGLLTLLYFKYSAFDHLAINPIILNQIRLDLVAFSRENGGLKNVNYLDDVDTAVGSSTSALR